MRPPLVDFRPDHPEELAPKGPGLPTHPAPPLGRDGGFYLRSLRQAPPVRRADLAGMSASSRCCSEHGVALGVGLTPAIQTHVMAASVVSDSVRPPRRQPTRLPHPWAPPGKNTGVGCRFLLQCMKVKSESEVAQSCPLFETSGIVAQQTPPSMGFSRQEHWSGVPLPSPPLC